MKLQIKTKVDTINREIEKITKSDKNPQEKKEAIAKKEKEGDIDTFERFLAHIELFQHPQFYFTKGLQEKLDQFFEDTQGRTLKNVYSIAGSFTSGQLQHLLEYENIIQDDTLIIIFANSHATGLFKHGDSWYYFNSSFKIGEIEIPLQDELKKETGTLILASHDSNLPEKTPLPLGISIFSVMDTKNKNTEEINENIEKIKASYPNQKTVLDTVFKDVVDHTIYERTKSDLDGDTALIMSIIVGSPESVDWHLKNGADPNTKNNNMYAFTSALIFENNEIISAFLQNKALTENTIKLSVEQYIGYLGIKEEEEQKKEMQATTFRLKEVRKQYFSEHIPHKPLPPKPQKILNYHRS